MHTAEDPRTDTSPHQGSSSKEFYEDMTRGRHLLKCKHEKIFDNVFALGLMSPAALDPTLSSNTLKAKQAV